MCDVFGYFHHSLEISGFGIIVPLLYQSMVGVGVLMCRRPSVLQNTGAIPMAVVTYSMDITNGSANIQHGYMQQVVARGAIDSR
jgi:hypothetical protein